MYFIASNDSKKVQNDNRSLVFFIIGFSSKQIASGEEQAEKNLRQTKN